MVAILVVIAAITFPSAQELYRSARVTAGADTLRAALTQGRLHAIEQGRPYRVAIVQGQGNIRVAPESSEFWAGGGQDRMDNGESGVEILYVLEAQAPQQVTLTLVGSSAPVTDYQQRDTSTIPPNEWTTVAVFFPDGTSHKDAQVRIQYPNTRSSMLMLRSLTGAVSVRQSTLDEEQQR